MIDYVSREAVLEILRGKGAPWDAYAKVQSLPAADVRPVEWIPVTERLPNVDEKVLTFARNKYDGSWFMDITSWTGVRNHDEYRFWGYGDSMKVTHWMSLPEPPKEEE